MSTDTKTPKKKHFHASFGGYHLANDTVKKGITKSWPVAGATAEYQNGANVKGKVTFTRVFWLGLFALFARKSRLKVYVSIIFEDGDHVLIEAKAKEEKAARTFAVMVNAASRYFSSQPA